MGPMLHPQPVWCWSLLCDVLSLCIDCFTASLNYVHDSLACGPSQHYFCMSVRPHGQLSGYVSSADMRSSPVCVSVPHNPSLAAWCTCRHQMAAFSQDYDVVALDMRGYNTSDKPQVGGAALPAGVLSLCGVTQQGAGVRLYMVLV